MLMNAFVKSSRSSRIAFSAAIVGIFTVAAYNWMVSPYTKYLYATQQYELMVCDVAKQNQIIKNKEAVKKKEIEQLRAELAKAQAALFTPVEADRFFSDIEALCNQTNCAVYSINFLSGNSGELPTGEKNSEAIVENSAAVSFVGSYGNIINFLSKLTNRPQKVFLRSLKVTASGNRSSPLVCEVLITVYIVRDKEIFTNE
jgi:Tfp pilus assembly protein PilO